MLCKAGRITKDDIGAIRIQEVESFVEIREAAVAGFLEALGGKSEIEPGAVITRLDSAPDIARSPRPKLTSKKHGKPASAPIDWNDEATPRRRKPKPAPHRKNTKSDRPDRPEPNAVVEPRSKRKPKPKGPPPPIGKPSSKKNKARKKAAAFEKAKARKGKGPRPS